MVVGGKYVQQLNQVMEMVDQIRLETERVPSAVFIFPDEKYDVGLDKIDLTTRDVFSPTMVCLLRFQ